MSPFSTAADNVDGSSCQFARGAVSRGAAFDDAPTLDSGNKLRTARTVAPGEDWINELLGRVAIIWVKWIAMLTVLLWFGSQHHAMVPRAVTHRRCRYHDRSGLLIVRDSTAC